MKKSALLAVSALSLGVVGLATFTPIVNAATSMTGSATVTVKVSENLAIGDTDITPGETGQSDGGEFGDALSVDFGTVGASEKASDQTKTLAIRNNSGKAGALTISATDASLKGENGDNIPAGATIAAGTSAWAVKSTGTSDAWKAVSNSPLSLGTDTGNGQTNYSITYGLSTDATQVAGSYTGLVTYTYTIADLSK